MHTRAFTAASNAVRARCRSAVQFAPSGDARLLATRTIVAGASAPLHAGARAGDVSSASALSTRVPPAYITAAGASAPLHVGVRITAVGASASLHVVARTAAAGASASLHVGVRVAVARASVPRRGWCSSSPARGLHRGMEKAFSVVSWDVRRDQLELPGPHRARTHTAIVAQSDRNWYI